MRLRGNLLRSSVTPFAALATLAGAFAFVACSDNNSNNSDDPAESSSATSTTVTPTTLPPTSTPGAEPTSPAGVTPPREADKTYARQLCTSLDAYLHGFLQEAAKDPALLTDETKLLKIAGPAITGLGNDLQKATPPADLKDYHNQLVAKTREVSEKVANGRITSVAEIANVTTGIKPPSKAIQDRLRAAIGETKECQDSILAGGLFGA